MPVEGPPSCSRHKQLRRTRSRGPHTPCTEGNLQSALTTQKWVTSPWCTPSPLANRAVQAIRVGHPCSACKNRSTSPAGPYPHSEAPARRPPEGPPGSGPSVPPVPTMATHTVDPASRGIMHIQNVPAQDLHHLGCLLSSPRRQPVLTTAPPRPVHKRRAQATSCRSSVPAISLLIQGALRARERGRCSGNA